MKLAALYVELTRAIDRGMPLDTDMVVGATASSLAHIDWIKHPVVDGAGAYAVLLSEDETK